MSRYVEDGVVDVGLTGADWVLENGSDVATFFLLTDFFLALDPDLSWIEYCFNS